MAEEEGLMLDIILKKCKASKRLSDGEIRYLLTRESKEETDAICRAAREIRDRHFGGKVFMYGFVYFSTYCKNSCSFCYYRKENEEPPRYRKSEEEILSTARALKESGVHLLDLTTGDDPYYTKHPERLAELIKKVKEETGLAVMLSPGLLDKEGLSLISEAGADWYALYQETHTRELYRTLRLGQSYEKRMEAKRQAAAMGLLIEEGLLTGVGDSLEDRIHSFREMEDLHASQVRTMTFIPQQGAPLKRRSLKADPFEGEIRNISVMRLLFPELLIPASLDVEGLKGLKTRLDAGANVVTSIIPPHQGYAGVANSVQDIDEGYRTVEGIQDTLKACGLTPATAGEYKTWVRERKAYYERSDRRRAAARD